MCFASGVLEENFQKSHYNFLYLSHNYLYKILFGETVDFIYFLFMSVVLSIYTIDCLF